MRSGLDGLATPAILGVMSAARSQSVLAFVAWRGLSPRLGGRVGRAVTTVSLAGEIVGDKMPFVPDRTSPGPLFGRTAIGAVGGTLAARRHNDPGLAGALVGGVTAWAATFTLRRLRVWLVARTPVPDLVWAVAEDACVGGLAFVAARRLKG